MSGLSHTPGKRARGKTLRGFESRLLRQKASKNAPSGAFFISIHQFTLHQIRARTSLKVLFGE